MKTARRDQGFTPVKPKIMQLFTSKAGRAIAIIAFMLLVILDELNGIDWSRFAYVQYVTNTAYLCNSVMLFEILHRLGSKAHRLMMLLRQARDKYGVKLMPIEIQRRATSEATWAEGYTKLLAFNQTQYDRVLSLDSDSTVLQTMDELFIAPSAPVAMPRAYWLNFDDRILSAQLILIEPSVSEFNRPNDYDMEIVNNLYKDSCLILPHRPYNLLTGEFRSDKHSDYLGNSEEESDPEKTFKVAKFRHFSDWPVPKQKNVVDWSSA
ncbi:nucleotide-diphospho-sugar transferase [Lipomyces tetrasporus]